MNYEYKYVFEEIKRISPTPSSSLNDKKHLKTVLIFCQSKNLDQIYVKYMLSKNLTVKVNHH